jgi:hypothetical protein
MATIPDHDTTAAQAPLPRVPTFAIDVTHEERAAIIGALQRDREKCEKFAAEPVTAEGREVWVRLGRTADAALQAVLAAQDYSRAEGR